MSSPIPWGRVAVAVWAAALLGVAVHGYLYPQIHTVYDVYSPAAHKWWAGADIYVLGKDYFRYSPLFAIAFTPFALLPDYWGNALWKVANALVLLAGLRAWLRHGLPVQLSTTATAVVFLLVLLLGMNSLYNGQANLLMLGAILFAMAAAARQRWSAAAGWLAAATLVKGYPLALAWLLAGLYPRRFPVRFAAALALGLLLPFATQAPQTVVAQYGSWFGHLRDSQHLMCERMRSLLYLCSTYGVRLPPDLFSLLGALAGAAVFGACLLHNRHSDQPGEQLTRTLVLFSAWSVVFGPFTEACTYVLVGPAVAWELVDAFRRPRTWVARLLLSASLLLMGPVATDLFGVTVHRLAEAYAAQPIGGLLFLGCLMTRPGRRSEAPLGEPAAEEMPRPLRVPA